MFEQFLASFMGPQGPVMNQPQQQQPQQPQQTAQVQGAPTNGQVGGAPPMDMNAFLTTLMQSLSQQQQQGGMGDIASLVKALRPDPLGEVARSNSRPSGFTPQAAWDAWGPGAAKPAPTSDARLGLQMGGGVDPRTGAPAPAPSATGSNPFDFFNLGGRTA